MDKNELSARKASLLEKRGAIVKSIQKGQAELLFIDGAIQDCEFWLERMDRKEEDKNPPVKLAE